MNSSLEFNDRRFDNKFHSELRDVRPIELKQNPNLDASHPTNDLRTKILFFFLKESLKEKRSIFKFPKKRMHRETGFKWGTARKCIERFHFFRFKSVEAGKVQRNATFRIPMRALMCQLSGWSALSGRYVKSRLSPFHTQHNHGRLQKRLFFLLLLKICSPWGEPGLTQSDACDIPRCTSSKKKRF